MVAFRRNNTELLNTKARQKISGAQWEREALRKRYSRSRIHNKEKILKLNARSNYFSNKFHHLLRGVWQLAQNTAVDQQTIKMKWATLFSELTIYEMGQDSVY